MKLATLFIALLFLLFACDNNASVKTQGSDSSNKVTENTSTSVQSSTDTNQHGQAPAPVASSSSALPAFRMMNGLGEIVDLAQFRGKKVFVNLWATWCPPCRAEIPSIESLGAKYDRSKVEFVMLSLDDNFEKAKNYAANNNMKLPIYYPASNLPQLFVTEGIPMTIIFNEKGEILFNQVGSADYDTKMFQDMLK